MRRYISLSWLIPLVVFILALLLRLIPLIRQPFDGLYGQDAYAYYDFAAALRNAALTGESPRAFFWGLGYPAVLASLFMVSGVSAGIAQAASILMGAAIPALISIIALKLKLRPLGALAAGLILVVCGQAVQSSLVVMADVPALFWSLCAALLLMIYSERRSLSTLVGSAICLALAILTRWLYGVLLIPFAWMLLSNRVPIKHVLLAMAAALILFLPQLLFNGIQHPLSIFNHAWFTGWSPANAVAQDFINVDGEFHYSQPNFQFYSAPLIDPYYFAPVLLPFTLLGVFSLRRRDSLFWYLWLLLPLAFLMGIPYQNIRFALIAMPAVAILTGAGVSRVVSVFSHSRLQPVRGVLVCTAVCLALVWMAQTANPTIASFLEIQNESKHSAIWAGSVADEDATIYAFGLTLTLEHYVQQQIEELYYFTPESLALQVQTGDYLLVNVWQLENQWVGQDVYTSYQYLRDERGMRRIGTHGYYTLYQIQ